MMQGMKRHKYPRGIIFILCTVHSSELCTVHSSQASNTKLQFIGIFHCDDEWTGLEVPIGNDTMIYSNMMMSGLG